MNAHCTTPDQNKGQPMSMLQKTDVYQGVGEKAAPSYGFLLVLGCLAIALVAAFVVFTPAVSAGVPPLDPYVGP